MSRVVTPVRRRAVSPASRAMGLASSPSQAQLTTRRIFVTLSGVDEPSRRMTEILAAWVAMALSSKVECIGTVVISAVLALLAVG